MKILSLTCAPAGRDLLMAELYERGTAGIVENELPDGRVVLDAFFSQWFQAPDFEPFDPRWAEAESRDWVAEFERAWEPLPVGERLVLIPHWMDSSSMPEGKVRLTVYPGLACGTGRHPTTQMCLRALERHLHPGDTVVDVGTGSGILSAAARLLGAGCVAGCDIDPDAVEVASQNLCREHLAAALWVGSLRSVRSGMVDLLLANINAEGVRALSGEIRRVLRPAGIAVVSGFPIADRDRALDGNTLGVAEVLQQDDWMAIILRKS